MTRFTTVALLVGLLLCTSAAADCPARLIAGPSGTLELAAVASNQATFVAAAREAATGKFTLWSLEPCDGNWVPLHPGQSFRYPLAIGIGESGSALVVDARAGDATASLLRTGLARRELALGPGLARTILYDRREGVWLVGGVFGTTGAEHLVKRVAADGTVSGHVPADGAGWVTQSRAEFTGLALIDDQLFVSNPASCVVRVIDRKSLAAVDVYDLRPQAKALGLQLVCEAGAGAQTKDDVDALADASAWPLQLMAVDGALQVLTRRPQRTGWASMLISPAGGARVVRDQASVQRPLASVEQGVLYERADLQEPGTPFVAEWRPGRTTSSGLMNATSGAPRGTSSPGASVRAAVPEVLVDARICVGDVAAAIAQARASGGLPREPVLLGLTNATEGRHLDEYIDALRRHLKLRGVPIRWQKPVPVDFKETAKGLWLMKGE